MLRHPKNWRQHRQSRAKAKAALQHLHNLEGCENVRLFKRLAGLKKPVRSRSLLQREIAGAAVIDSDQISAPDGDVRVLLKLEPDASCTAREFLDAVSEGRVQELIELGLEDDHGEIVEGRRAAAESTRLDGTPQAGCRGQKRDWPAVWPPLRHRPRRDALRRGRQEARPADHREPGPQRPLQALAAAGDAAGRPDGDVLRAQGRREGQSSDPPGRHGPRRAQEERHQEPAHHRSRSRRRRPDQGPRREDGRARRHGGPLLDALSHEGRERRLLRRPDEVGREERPRGRRAHRRAGPGLLHRQGQARARDHQDHPHRARGAPRGGSW